LAVQRRRRAEVLEAEAQRTRVIDQVRREVAAARALALARRRQLDLAEGRVRTAEEGYRLELTRTRNLIRARAKGGPALPIEVLDSLRQLTAARQDLVRALVEYDQAQFQLFVALGQPPRP
jgi:outer membrane protein TolC